MNKYKKHIKKHWYCFILGPLFMTLEGAGEFILPFINANMINIGASCIIQIKGIPRKKVEKKIPQCRIRLLTLDG